MGIKVQRKCSNLNRLVASSIINFKTKALVFSGPGESQKNEM